MTLTVTPYNLIGCYQRIGTPNCLGVLHSHDAGSNRLIQILLIICQTTRRHR